MNNNNKNNNEYILIFNIKKIKWLQIKNMYINWPNRRKYKLMKLKKKIWRQSKHLLIK